jgi:hypothetical protein
MACLTDTAVYSLLYEMDRDGHPYQLRSRMRVTAIVMSKITWNNGANPAEFHATASKSNSDITSASNTVRSTVHVGALTPPAKAPSSTASPAPALLLLLLLLLFSFFLLSVPFCRTCSDDPSLALSIAPAIRASAALSV